MLSLLILASLLSNPAAALTPQPIKDAGVNFLKQRCPGVYRSNGESIGTVVANRRELVWDKNGLQIYNMYYSQLYFLSKPADQIYMQLESRNGIYSLRMLSSNGVCNDYLK